VINISVPAQQQQKWMLFRVQLLLTITKVGLNVLLLKARHVKRSLMKKISFIENEASNDAGAK
jgi:ABC-type uncharacterized transport system YnjBCD ATPase subunit